LDDGLDVYFRNADVGVMGGQDAAVYIAVEPGDSEPLERAFPGAPPQISHTIQDMLPISFEDNSCLDCHHPENTTSKEEAPVPDSHFERPVMGKGQQGEPLVWVVKTYEKTSDVAGARYNCVTCHTPQALNVRTPRSLFLTGKSHP
jgi:cytochrome c-type protein NapB